MVRLLSKPAEGEFPGGMAWAIYSASATVRSKVLRIPSTSLVASFMSNARSWASLASGDDLGYRAAEVFTIG
jgi:hypothetical protein